MKLSQRWLPSDKYPLTLKLARGHDGQILALFCSIKQKHG